MNKNPEILAEVGLTSDELSVRPERAQVLDQAELYLIGAFAAQEASNAFAE